MERFLITILSVHMKKKLFPEKKENRLNDVLIYDLQTVIDRKRP